MLVPMQENWECEAGGSGRRALCSETGESLIVLDASWFGVRLPDSSVSLGGQS